MGFVENIEKRISYGKPCMERLSELTVKEIISAIDVIWENSCSNIYETLPIMMILKRNIKIELSQSIINPIFKLIRSK